MLNPNITSSQAREVFENLDWYLEKFQSETGHKVTAGAKEIIIRILERKMKEAN